MAAQPTMPQSESKDLGHMPGLVWRDRWGNIDLTLAEWDRLKWWQQIRYNLFGILPADFERDALID